MEIQRAHRPPPLPPQPAVAAVLGDDDLLREILLRLGLPTSLLRAALACKRWYRAASDPAFLRRFRDRHPPRVLGAYLNFSGISLPRFVPVRPLPELAAEARRAGSFFSSALRGSSAFVRDSRGGRLLVTTSEEHYGDVETTELVCVPLFPAADAVVVPPPPTLPLSQLTGTGRQEPMVYHYSEFLPVNNGGDGRSYTCVLIACGTRRTIVRLYELQDMHWVARASAAADFPVTLPRVKLMLSDESKFYILSATNKILVCDFPTSSISTMDLPNGVESDDTGRNFLLSRGDGSAIFLMHVKGSLLCVFHCRTGGDESSNWSLVNSICLRKVCTNLGIAACTSVEGHDAGVKIHAVGDGAKFVFLDMFGTVSFLDIASMHAEKVCEIRLEGKELLSVHPLKMIWHQPVFPVPKEG